MLSDSTERFDRVEKFSNYREIESLREYVLVSQDTARVETYFRQDDGVWRFDPRAGLDAVATLMSIGVDLPLAEVYANVVFPPAAEDASAVPPPR
ncbi:MAG TPA: Uma2 family endonuclease [Humisphaera sp.]